MSETNKYHNYPFCEISKDDCYTYARVEELLKVCEQYKNKIHKCRTLGVLNSINGRFYLQNMDLPLYKTNSSIRVSMVYLKQQLKTTVRSQVVQIFGTLQWKNEPVLFVQILQEIHNMSMATQLNEIVNAITADHLVKRVNKDQEEIY